MHAKLRRNEWGKWKKWQTQTKEATKSTFAGPAAMHWKCANCMSKWGFFFAIFNNVIRKLRYWKNNFSWIVQRNERPHVKPLKRIVWMAKLLSHTTSHLYAEKKKLSEIDVINMRWFMLTAQGTCTNTRTRTQPKLFYSTGNKVL